MKFSGWASRCAVLCISLGSFGALGQTVLVPNELPNLGKLETELKDYHDCRGDRGCYTTDLDREAAAATAALHREVRGNRARGTHGVRLAVVLDIDETSLSNWEEIAQQDFAYSKDVWDRWVEEGRAPAIASTLHFYQEAQRLGVAVFFITGRSEDQRSATEKNLRGAGYAQWAGLILRKPDEAEIPTTVYKAAARRRIVAEGYRIAVNMGDQMSDLKGWPRADVSVKLSDPFYYIP